MWVSILRSIVILLLVLNTALAESTSSNDQDKQERPNRFVDPLNQLLIQQDDILLRLLGYQSSLKSMRIEGKARSIENQQLIEDTRDLMVELVSQPNSDEKINIALVFLCDSPEIKTDCTDLKVLDWAMVNDPGNALYPIKKWLSVDGFSNQIKKKDTLDAIKQSEFYNGYYGLGAKQVRVLLLEQPSEKLEQYNFDLYYELALDLGARLGLNQLQSIDYVESNIHEISVNQHVFGWMLARTPFVDLSRLKEKCSVTENNEICEKIGALLFQSKKNNMLTKMIGLQLQLQLAKQRQDYETYQANVIDMFRKNVEMKCVQNNTNKISVIIPEFISTFINNIEKQGEEAAMRLAKQAALEKMRILGSQDILPEPDDCDFSHLTDEMFVQRYEEEFPIKKYLDGFYQ